MKTTLPLGTWVKYRYRGEWEYALLVPVNGEVGIELCEPPTGAIVQCCVWKGENLEPRGTPKIYEEVT